MQWRIRPIKVDGVAATLCEDIESIPGAIDEFQVVIGVFLIAAVTRLGC